MLVPFDQLPDQARIWIYPSNRKFKEDEIPKVSEALTRFLDHA